MLVPKPSSSSVSSKKLIEKTDSDPITDKSGAVRSGALAGPGTMSLALPQTGVLTVSPAS